MLDILKRPDLSIMIIAYLNNPDISIKMIKSNSDEKFVKTFERYIEQIRNICRKNLAN